MSNGKYLDAIKELLEDNVIREVIDREAPRWPDHDRNPGTRRGKSFDQFERSFDLRYNLSATSALRSRYHAAASRRSRRARG